MEHNFFGKNLNKGVIHVRKIYKDNKTICHRTISYGGANNILMYKEEIPLNSHESYFETKGHSPSTIHHFYEKLFRLADNMNTKTAKEQAIVRTEFMKKFVNEFLEEWEGLK